MNSDDTRIIIAGATSGIGLRYLNYFLTQEYETIGLTSSEKKETATIHKLDLMDATACTYFINSQKTEKRNTIYLHIIGQDKFEDYGPNLETFNHEVDNEIYSSNVTTLQNFANPLISKCKKEESNLKIVNIASISDQFLVPYWYSYSFSKNKVREYLKEESQQEHISSLVINVSSVITEKEILGRPFGDISTWLDLDSLLTGSISNILSKNEKYQEMDIYKPLKDWNESFFTDTKRVYTRRMYEMHGIKI
jgi:NADP-dependent 3-hydroxy acid dehydrogenase YdfG